MKPTLWRVTLTALVGALALATLPVVAQETTGSIAGKITDDTGAALPGVAVEGTGPPGTIRATTDAQGKYRFPKVPPGKYQLMARLEGLQDAESNTLTVSLGQVLTVDFTMYADSFSEEIIVTSDQVFLDFEESQTATSITKIEIETLPRGRDFTDVVAFAAGTVDDNQAGGISIDGASGLENRYVIDGIDTTDPEDGGSAIPMRAEFMEEVQVKSAGYAAEFGGSTGGVINAVTRSGSSQFKGSVFADYEDMSWNGSARSELEYGLTDDVAFSATYPKDDETRLDPGFSLGGPILKDNLWFFGTYQPGIRSRKRTVDWVSFAPQTYTSDFDVDYTMFNLTANVGGSLLLKAGLNNSPYTTDGLLPNRDGRSDLPDQDNWAPLGVEGERETYSLTADWIARDNLVVSARGGFYRTNVEDTGVPTFDLIHNYSTSSRDPVSSFPGQVPGPAQQSPGWFSDNFQSPVDQKNIYERTAFGIDGTWNVEAGGEHTIKLGFQSEEIYNDVQSGYNADRILYYWDRSYTTTFGDSVRGEYGYFRLLNIATLGDVKTTNDALFIQDTWNVTNKLTLNLGVRAEKEEVPNYGATGPDPAIKFDYDDKLAPRLGFAYDVKGDAQWKVYGSYGTYYDVTKYEMPRGSFGGAKWVDFFFTLDNPDIFLNDPAGCSTGSNTIFDNPNCGAGQLIEPVDRRFNSVDPLFQDLVGVPGVDPDLKPMELWEFQLGVDHQLTPRIEVGARFVHKEIVRAIEDVGFLFPGIGEVYIIANPGEGIVGGPDADGLTYPKAEREYDALELTLHKSFSNNWSLRAYYTLSRLYGNYSGLANSDEQNNFGNPLNAANTAGRLSPNVSRLFDTVTSMYDADGNHVFGKLATDRTHQLGAQVLYNTPFGLSIGASQYVGSGTPRSEIATVPTNSYFYPEGRGTLGETPWLTQTDVSLWQRWDISRYGISLGLTVLNLFDQDTVLRYWGARTQQDLEVTNADFAAGGFDYNAEVANLGPTGLDTAYNLPDTYQAPRELRLSVKFDF